MTNTTQQTTAANPLTQLSTKRQWLTAAALASSTLLLSACYGIPRKHPVVEFTPEQKRWQQKFRGIYGVVTRIDAANIKEFVSITTDTGAQIDGSGSLSPKNVSNSSYGGGFPIPVTVRATWKKDPKKDIVHGKDPVNNGGWLGGIIVGDYTVPVAERIPDEVLDYIRKNGGALRLKIRLHDEGIFIGWDVERSLPIPNLPRDYSGPKEYHAWLMAGGDFCEPKISHGEIIKHAWYINKQGNKVFTDENPYAMNYDPTRPVRTISGVHE